MLLELHSHVSVVQHLVNVLVLLSLLHDVQDVLVHLLKLARLRRQTLLDVRGREDVLQIGPILLASEPIVNGFLSVQDLYLQLLHSKAGVLKIARAQDVIQVGKTLVQHRVQLVDLKKHVHVFFGLNE